LIAIKIRLIISYKVTNAMKFVGQVKCYLIRNHVMMETKLMVMDVTKIVKLKKILYAIKIQLERVYVKNISILQHKLISFLYKLINTKFNSLMI